MSQNVVFPTDHASVSTGAAGPVVEIRGLSRRFGATTALDNVHLNVPRGCVFGLVGENGAGKTTLLKHVLGLLKAHQGEVRVFGLDPVAHPVEVLGRTGQLSEDRDLPAWMRVGEFIDYMRAFYPHWDNAYAGELERTFELRRNQKIPTLSRGQKARLGLLVALAYRPDLLVLDEPSSGLDPVVRRDILGAIIRTVADEGRTVLFSSHLLDEVQRVSDQVAMLHKGKLLLTNSLDQILTSHHRLTIRFAEPRNDIASLAGVLWFEPAAIGLEANAVPSDVSRPEGSRPDSFRSMNPQREWTLVCNGRREELVSELAQRNAQIVEETSLSLDEIFIARVHAQMDGGMQPSPSTK